MTLLAIIMSVWIVAVLRRMDEFEYEASHMPEDGLIRDTERKYEYPCYDAPCVNACPFSASCWEATACANETCRHWQDCLLLHNCKKIGSRSKCTGFTRYPWKLLKEGCEKYKLYLKGD